MIGKPEIARSNRSNQLFFVNRRHIKDKVLTGATEKAFKGMIPIGKYGFVVLNIDMEPSKVDVNVHPSKQEVRLSKEAELKELIYDSIKEIFMVKNIAPRITSDEVNIKGVQESLDLNVGFSNYMNIGEYNYAGGTDELVSEKEAI